MSDHTNITPELLRQLLRYEPNTGKLFWLPRPKEMFNSEKSFKTFNSQFAGREALTANTAQGYKHGCIWCKKYLAHRVIWILLNGHIDDGFEIDHLNGLKHDNRISNLRLATKAQNNANRPNQENTSSGVKGVSWDKCNKKWEANIVVNYKKKRLGRFDSLDEAEAAYLAAAEEHQGQFAHHNRARR